MSNYTFAQNQEVEFNLPIGKGVVLSGTARVVGVAVSAVAVLGATYMLKPIKFTGTVSAPNEEYPFECFPMPEKFIKPVAKFSDAE